jgi:hypothetical protein
MAEMKMFVFAIVFIIIFSGLLVSVPTDFEGQGITPDGLTPVDPALISGFDDYEAWNMTDLNAYNQYEYYAFNGRDWFFEYYQGTKDIVLGAKIVYGGFLWFGQLDSCEFISNAGVNRGGVLTDEEIELDASSGSARYDLRYIIDGSDAGGFVIYWNVTAYASVSDAYAADKVNFLHGVGIGSNARMDIGSLLLGLLLLQLPDCPLLINLLLATPLYAAVIYLLWFIIKETLPFV